MAFLFGLVPTVHTKGADDAEITANTPKSETFWIGVQVTPVPELFLSHFGVNDESGSLIAVDHVVPDSPAAKAGMKRGDVFIKFGEKEIYSIADLIEQTAKDKETATKLEVIRNGAKTTLTVTPALRPEEVQSFPGTLNLREIPRMSSFDRRLLPNFPPNARDPQLMLRQMEELFRQMQVDGDGFVLPGISQSLLQSKDNTGKQLAVTMQTQNGKTSIKVTQVLTNGDNPELKTWEVESVDELPEEIRGEVKTLLGQ